MSKTTEVDFLIVGQGLAGTLLTHQLLQEGCTLRVLDAAHQSASSAVAAGIINPITGYRFVKSWLLEELLPVAEASYGELEQLLGQAFFQKREILRVLFSAGEENDWLARTAQEGWSQYVKETEEWGAYRDIVHAGFGQGVLLGAQVNVRALINKYQQYLLDQNLLELGNFDYQQLKIQPDQVQYQNWTAKTIVFCEGHQGTQNPWFSYLPFEVVKGEVFIIKLNQIQAQRILKHKILLAPLGNDLFWAGANYEHKALHDLPSDRGRNFIIDKLQQVLKISYEEIAHQAAIRPATFDRRPFLGRHPDHPALAIFNGLGAKGASIAPYFAHQLSNHLRLGTPLTKEADINRVKEKNK